jgi:hypothetical protein
MPGAVAIRKQEMEDARERLPIVLSGPSVRRKRHENVMSIVMGSGPKS